MTVVVFPSSVSVKLLLSVRIPCWVLLWAKSSWHSWQWWVTVTSNLHTQMHTHAYVYTHMQTLVHTLVYHIHMNMEKENSERKNNQSSLSGIRRTVKLCRVESCDGKTWRLMTREQAWQCVVPIVGSDQRQQRPTMPSKHLSHSGAIPLNLRGWRGLSRWEWVNIIRSGKGNEISIGFCTQDFPGTQPSQ